MFCSLNDCMIACLGCRLGRQACLNVLDPESSSAQAFDFVSSIHLLAYFEKNSLLALA